MSQIACDHFTLFSLDDGSNNVVPAHVVPSHVVPAHVPAPVAKPIAPVAMPAPTPLPPASSTPASGPVQPTQTSWAAAAGKGLPTTTNDQTHTTSTASASNGSTSKHLEQLNSVREALFSQDGWGGSNVKQDSAWNVEGIPAPTNQGLNQPAPVPGGPSGGNSSGGGAENSSGGKESNTWGSGGSGHRNDGTDLWRVNLSGQPPVAKPQPNNAWNHTPQNNTDFKQWGVDDGEDGAGGSAGGAAAPNAPGSNGAIGGNRPQGGLSGNMNAVGSSAGGGDSMWGPDASNNGPAPTSNQFQKRNNDWGGTAVNSGGSWGETPRGNGGGDPMMNRNMNDAMSGHRGGDAGNGASGVGGGTGGWGPAPPNKQPLNQWGNNPGSRNNNSWDLESPNMQRREGGGRGDGGVGRGGGGGGLDDGGTSHWGGGFKPQGPQGPAPGPPGTFPSIKNCVNNNHNAVLINFFT